MQTNVQTGYWVRCFQCGHPVDLASVLRRPRVTGVTRLHNLLGIRVGEYVNTQVVDVCPTCEAQEIEAQRLARGRVVLALGSGTAAVWMWPHFGGFGLLGALIITVLGSLWQRYRNRKALIMRERER